MSTETQAEVREAFAAVEDELSQAHMRIRAQENTISDLRSQYNDCAGRIGVDADRLAQTEQLLTLANDDITYLKRSLEHAKHERDRWHERAEGCMAEKDELLTRLDEIKSAPRGGSDKDAERAIEVLLQMLDGCKEIIMDQVKPGMSQMDIMKMQMEFAAKVMKVAEKIPGINE